MIFFFLLPFLVGNLAFDSPSTKDLDKFLGSLGFINFPRETENQNFVSLLNHARCGDRLAFAEIESKLNHGNRLTNKVPEIQNKNLVATGYYVMLLNESQISSIIPPNPAKVLELSAEFDPMTRKQGISSSSHEQLILGYLNYHGMGCNKNMNEAVRWFRLAAEQGNSPAQQLLGECYENGEGVDQDIAEAMKWYRLSADEGNPIAQYQLGLRYQYGRGVDLDLGEGLKWHRIAADQGYFAAQYHLGECYKKGEGVDQDIAEAMRWYRLSANQGYADAQHNLRLSYMMDEPESTMEEVD